MTKRNLGIILNIITVLTFIPIFAMNPGQTGAGASGAVSTIDASTIAGVIMHDANMNTERAHFHMAHRHLHYRETEKFFTIFDNPLYRNACIVHTDPLGLTLLYPALATRNHRVVAALLSAGANPNHKAHPINEDGTMRKDRTMTPLSYAASIGDIESVKLLVKHTADVNACDEDNNTPLNIAAISNQLATVDFLLNNKANVNIQTKELGYTPLISSLRTNHRALVRRILQANPNLQLKARFVIPKSGIRVQRTALEMAENTIVDLQISEEYVKHQSFHQRIIENENIQNDIKEKMEEQARKLEARRQEIIKKLAAEKAAKNSSNLPAPPSSTTASLTAAATPTARAVTIAAAPPAPMPSLSTEEVQALKDARDAEKKERAARHAEREKERKERKAEQQALAAQQKETKKDTAQARKVASPLIAAHAKTVNNRQQTYDSQQAAKKAAREHWRKENAAINAEARKTVDTQKVRDRQQRREAELPQQPTQHPATRMGHHTPALMLGAAPAPPEAEITREEAYAALGSLFDVINR